MSEIKVDTLTGKTTSNDITVTVGASATMSMEQGLAKHFAVFDGTGTAAIDTSFNNSSLTDNGTGHYTVTITSVFSSIHFVFTGATIGNNEAFTYVTTSGTVKTTSTSDFQIWQYNGAKYDVDTIDVISHGDLA